MRARRPFCGACCIRSKLGSVSMISPVSLPLPPSLYADTAVAPTPAPPLDADKNVSGAIIGGGFTGLSTALHLAEQEVDETVLEAQQPGGGATGHNGGRGQPRPQPEPR